MLMKMRGQGQALSVSQPLAISGGKSKNTKQLKAVEKTIFLFYSIFRATSQLAAAVANDTMW